MTCIAALVHKNHVWMGGDSAGISGTDIRVRADSKVFHNGDFLFGCCGSFRMINLLKYNFVPPENELDLEEHEFLSTIVTAELRKVFNDGGFARTQEGSEVGGTFLLGYSGRLYHVDEDYQVGFYDPQEEIASVGCGSQYALGAMYAIPNAAPKRRLLVALEAAARFSAGVRGPFLILHE